MFFFYTQNTAYGMRISDWSFRRVLFRSHARTLIGHMKGATLGRLLTSYLLLRQVTAALGLTSVAGHPQTVRPLVAPMAEAAAEQQHGDLDGPTREKAKAYSAATDNVGLFFAEDILISIGTIMLMKGVLEHSGIDRKGDL